MITRHHLSLTLLCTLILCCAFFQGNWIWLVIVIIAAEIGTLLPDIQMKKPSRFRSLTLAWYITRYSERICVPILLATYRVLLPTPLDKTDKRLTHSLPGIFCIFMSVAAILFIPALISGNKAIDFIVGAFLGGLALGLLLHIILDLCTRKGIFLFFPLDSFQIRGSIRPCDTGDRRILYFHLTCFLVLAGMIALVIHEPAGSALLWPAGILGFAFCIGTMILFSRRNGPGDTRYIRHGREESAGPLISRYPR